ncbi:hypothetical protein V6N13_038127 [Hibiscus sabdariffa]|uniref:Uncharacterized protein n=1 Tax=Hibiscus sabdariffa TaxID=183260 RepID=A0ABR2S364_9ROSI
MVEHRQNLEKAQELAKVLEESHDVNVEAVATANIRVTTTNDEVEDACVKAHKRRRSFSNVLKRPKRLM